MYDTTSADGQPSKVSLKVDDALEKVFFLFMYTNNPDGRVHTTRWNANGFDLNRDNSYQTQSETRSVAEQIAKWSPISFLDMHGFDGNFLIEPATPPHDPNVEYDLLIDSMLEQANAMAQLACQYQVRLLSHSLRGISKVSRGLEIRVTRDFFGMG